MHKGERDGDWEEKGLPTTSTSATSSTGIKLGAASKLLLLATATDLNSINPDAHRIHCFSIYFNSVLYIFLVAHRFACTYSCSYMHGKTLWNNTNNSNNNGKKEERKIAAKNNDNTLNGVNARREWHRTKTA